MKSDIPVCLFSRSSSKRLPFKALLPFGNVPLIVFIHKRLSLFFSNITVLTSSDHTDDLLCHTLKSNNINFYRGSLNSTFERALEFSKKNSIDGFFRVCADSPIYPVHELYYISQKYLSKYPHSIISNVYPNRTWPKGFSIEFIPTDLLSNAPMEHLTNSHHEHLSAYFYDMHNLYSDRIIALPAPLLNIRDFRASIDSPDDYTYMNRLVANIKEN